MSVDKTVKIYVEGLEPDYMVINASDLKPEYVLYEDYLDQKFKEKKTEPKEDLEEGSEDEPVKRKTVKSKKPSTTLDQ